MSARQRPIPQSPPIPYTPFLIGVAIVLLLTCFYLIGVRRAALVAQTDAQEIALEDATVCVRLVIIMDQGQCAAILNAVRARERMRNQRDSETLL